LTFVSRAALDVKVPERYGLQRPADAVEHCRDIGKKDLPNNSATPDIRVDPDTYRVWADGELFTCEPAVLPLAQRYFLF
jgi:urease subunit alpha